MQVNDNRKFWDRWAGRYDWMMKTDAATYERIAENIRSALNREMIVLELACATGILSELIADRLNHLEATDFSEQMITEARKRQQSANIHYALQDATRISYPDHMFDAVIISNALHILPHPEKALAEIRRVLKPGGILFAPTYTAAESFFGKIKVCLMELSGFRVFHKWNSRSYLRFLQSSGFQITSAETFGTVLKLTYVQAQIMEDL